MHCHFVENLMVGRGGDGGTVRPRGPNFIERELPSRSWPAIDRYVSVGASSSDILTIGLPSWPFDVRWAVVAVYYILRVCPWGGGKLPFRIRWQLCPGTALTHRVVVHRVFGEALEEGLLLCQEGRTRWGGGRVVRSITAGCA